MGEYGLVRPDLCGSPNAQDFASLENLDLGARLQRVSWADESNFVAANIYADQSRWVMFYFSLTAILLSAASVIASLTARSVIAQRSAPLLAMTGQIEAFSHVVNTQSALTTGLAVVAGGTIGSHLSAIFLAMGSAHSTFAFIATVSVVMVLAHVWQAHAFRRELEATTTHYRPGK